jgi:hypothetical protein
VEHRVEELQVEDEENVDFLLFTPVTWNCCILCVSFGNKAFITQENNIN